MRVRYFTFIVALLCTGAMVAQTSIDSLQQVIYTNNLELQALVHAHQARMEEMTSENIPNGPSVEYSPFYTKGYHGVASSELIVSQEIDFPTQYTGRHKQAHLESSSMNAQYEVRKREIGLEARLLIYDIICKNEMSELLSERLQQDEQTTALLQKRIEAGDANALELNKAKLDYLQAAQKLAEEEAGREALLKELQRLNGGKRIEVNEHEMPEIQLPDESTIASLPVLPEIEQAQEELRVSQHQEKMAKQSWLPSLRVGYRRNTEESAKLNGFLVGASFPLFSSASRVKAARHQTESNALRLEMVQQEVSLKQQQQYELLKRMHQTLDHSDTNLLRETLALLHKAMQYGQITALNYYTECANIYDQLANHIVLHTEYVKTYSQLYFNDENAYRK